MIADPQAPPAEDIQQVSWETYMEHYAAHFYEWVEGGVIKMSPVHEDHDELSQYFVILFNAYFAHRPIGKLKLAPFVMRLERSREPDLQIVLNEHSAIMKPTYVDGAADIAIEIVSEGSVAIDYGAKFEEYEKGGVREYWLLDPIRQEHRFFRLSDTGVYQSQGLDDEGNYHTPLLPGLALHVPTLWQHPLPDLLSVVRSVEAMLKDAL